MPRRARHEHITHHKPSDTFQIKLPTTERKPDGTKIYRYANAKTLPDAIKTRDELLRQVRDGTLPEPHQMTVTDLMTQYLEHRAGRVKKRTLDNYTFEVRKYITPVLGTVKLASLKPLQVESLQTQILQKHGPRAAHGAKATLSRALRQAVRWQLVPRNVAEGIESLRYEKQEFEVWEPEEVHAFLEMLRLHENPDVRSRHAMFYLELSTGLRVGELLALNWGDVQLSGKHPSIHVRRTITRDGGKAIMGTNTKTNRSRRLHLSRDQITSLEQHQAAQTIVIEKMASQWHDLNLLFPSSTGTLWHPSNMANSVWRPLSRPVDAKGKPLRVPWKPVRFHDLRHTYASLAIRAGMDIRLLADRLGHRDPAFTLRVYAHIFDRYRKSGAIEMQDLLKLEPENPDLDGTDDSNLPE